MEAPFNKALHLRYWQRCLRTLLPHHYTPNDSQRMTLGFFVIVAIDLLTPSSTTTPPTDQQQKQQPETTTNTKPILTPQDRRALRQWVLSCQHPQGGFCGSPTHVFPHQYQDMGMGNANIAATYFALLLLPMLSTEDDARGAFAGVDRTKTLRWLRRLQRSGDGSFGEVVYEVSPCPAGREGGKVVVGGGKDMRYCYLAATIRWILRGEGGEGHVEDIDVDALVAHIRRSQTYDGGFSESYRHESHAGYAYCAVAALALLDRPLELGKVAEGQTPCHKKSQALQKGIGDMPGFVSFLVSRQFVYLEPSQENTGKDYYEDDEEEDPDSANFLLANLSLADCTEAAKHVGFNGRCNKVADTCYTWWVLGSLSVLGVLDNGGDGDHPSLANNDNNTVDPIAIKAQREFLLGKTQHDIGGFGKRPGDPPDIYHSSLGLAALATLGYPGLKKFDSGLCVSVDTVRKIEKGRRGLIEMGRKKESSSGGRVDFGKNLMDMAVSMGGGERPDWLSV